MGNVLIDEKSHENILIFDISCKTSIGPKPLCVRFNQVDGFIRVYDGNRYLAFFRLERHDDTDNWIRYLVSLKSGITYILQKSKLILMIGKLLTLHNVVIFIKSVLNEDQNHYYYNAFLEVCS